MLLLQCGFYCGEASIPMWFFLLKSGGAASIAVQPKHEILRYWRYNKMSFQKDTAFFSFLGQFWPLKNRIFKKKNSKAIDRPSQNTSICPLSYERQQIVDNFIVYYSIAKHQVGRRSPPNVGNPKVKNPKHFLRKTHIFLEKLTFLRKTQGLLKNSSKIFKTTQGIGKYTCSCLRKND